MDGWIDVWIDGDFSRNHRVMDSISMLCWHGVSGSPRHNLLVCLLACFPACLPAFFLVEKLASVCPVRTTTTTTNLPCVSVGVSPNFRYSDYCHFGVKLTILHLSLNEGRSFGPFTKHSHRHISLVFLFLLRWYQVNISGKIRLG